METKIIRKNSMSDGFIDIEGFDSLNRKEREAVYAEILYVMAADLADGKRDIFDAVQELTVKVQAIKGYRNSAAQV